MITVETQLVSYIVMATTTITLVFGFFFYRILSKMLDHRFSTERTDQYASIFSKNRSWIGDLFSTVESHVYKYNLVSCILPKILEMFYSTLDMLKNRTQCPVSYCPLDLPFQPMVDVPCQFRQCPLINNQFMESPICPMMDNTFVESKRCPYADLREQCNDEPRRCPYADLQVQPYDNVSVKCPNVQVKKVAGGKLRSKKNRAGKKRVCKRNQDVFENNFNDHNIYSDFICRAAPEVDTQLSPIYTECKKTETTKPDTSNTENDMIANIMNLVTGTNKGTDITSLLGPIMKMIQSVPTSANPTSPNDALLNLFNGHNPKTLAKKEPTTSPISSEGQMDGFSVFELASSFDRATRICHSNEYDNLTMEDVDKRFDQLVEKLNVEKSVNLISFKFYEYSKPNDMVADFIRILYFKYVGKTEFLSNYKRYITQSKSNDVILTECLDDLEN